MKTIQYLMTLAMLAGFNAVAQRGEAYIPWAPTDIINLNDSVAVYLGASEINTPDPDEMFLAVVNPKGVESGPEVTLPGATVGMALFNGKIIAFYQPDKKSEQRDRSVHALLIDLASRKILEDKEVYSVPSEFLTEFIVERDEQGNFKGLLARITTAKSKRQIFSMWGAARFDDRTLSGTQSIGLVTLAPDLAPTLTTLTSVATQGTLLTGTVNTRGELFLVTSAAGSMVAEKFSASGEPAGKLSEPFFPRENSVLKVKGRVDALSDNGIIIAIRYEKDKHTNAEGAYLFDFAENKASVAKEDLLDKDYFRFLKADTTQGEKIKASRVKNIESLAPVSIVETRDYIAICKEIEYAVSSGSGSSYVTRYYADAAIITVYDHHMNVLRSITLDKTSESFIDPWPCIGIHLEGEKILAITTELPGVATLDEDSYSIDLKTGAIEKRKLRRGGMGRAAVTRPLYTFWMKDGFVMNFMESRGIGGHKVKTYFMPGEFE